MGKDASQERRGEGRLKGNLIGKQSSKGEKNLRDYQNLSKEKDFPLDRGGSS